MSLVTSSEPVRSQCACNSMKARNPFCAKMPPPSGTRRSLPSQECRELQNIPERGLDLSINLQDREVSNRLKTLASIIVISACSFVNHERRDKAFDILTHLGPPFRCSLLMRRHDQVPARFRSQVANNRCLDVNRSRHDRSIANVRRRVLQRPETSRARYLFECWVKNTDGAREMAAAPHELSSSVSSTKRDEIFSSRRP